MHYGTLPTDPRLLAEIAKAHARGFRTIMASDYELAVDILGAEVDEVFQPAPIPTPSPTKTKRS